MLLTRAERDLIRRRRRRHRRAALTLAAVTALTLWALTHHPASAPRARHRVHAHRHHPAPRPTAVSARTQPRHLIPNGGPPAPGHTAGPALVWRNFHGIALPTSPQAGPYHTSNGLAWGFNDTRTGALLAAVNIAVRTAPQWGPAIYGPTIRRQVTGPSAATLLAADARGYAALRAAAHVPDGQPAGRGYAAEAAYRFAAWSPAMATVDIVTEGPSTTGAVMTVTRIQVLWRAGDWRVLAPPGGDWANSAAVLSSLTGYTAFPNEG